MINRHHLRVKLLQWVFASWHKNPCPKGQCFTGTCKDDECFFECKQDDYNSLTQQFHLSASVSLRSLIMAFVLMEKLIQHANLRDGERSGKLLERNRKPGPGHGLANHPLAELLESDRHYRRALQLCKVENLEISSDMLRGLFDAIQEGKCLGSKIGYEELQEIAGLRIAFEKCISPGDWYSPWQMEHNLFWDSDRYLIDRQVVQILQKISDGEGFPDADLLLNSWQSDDRFVNVMFRELLHNSAAYQPLIEAHSGQWDPERLAWIDFLILQMACVELSLFPEIPIKVTINEYIELAKVYSTPQSSAFVNGLLDKIKSDMLQKGMISKSGRGLVES
jgi:N utilization substance protein B